MKNKHIYWMKNLLYFQNYLNLNFFYITKYLGINCQKKDILAQNVWKYQIFKWSDNYPLFKSNFSLKHKTITYSEVRSIWNLKLKVFSRTWHFWPKMTKKTFFLQMLCHVHQLNKQNWIWKADALKISSLIKCNIISR